MFISIKNDIKVIKISNLFYVNYMLIKSYALIITEKRNNIFFSLILSKLYIRY